MVLLSAWQACLLHGLTASDLFPACLGLTIPGPNQGIQKHGVLVYHRKPEKDTVQYDTSLPWTSKQSTSRMLSLEKGA
jgi:hypothetical protein